MRGIEEQGVAHHQWRGVSRIFGLEQRHVHLLHSAHLPPVEVKELRTLSTGEHQIQVMTPLHQLSEVSCQRLPFLPATCCWHLQAAEQLSLQTVDTHLDLSATQAAGHTGCEGAGQLIAETDILQFDIVAIVDIAHIDTYLIILFCLHPLRERHRLCLYPAIRVEGSHGLHALVSRQDGGEATISVILEFLDSHTTSKAATLWQFACVIEEIAMSFIVSYTTVVGKRVGIAQRHNLTRVFPRT